MFSRSTHQVSKMPRRRCAYRMDQPPKQTAETMKRRPTSCGVALLRGLKNRDWNRRLLLNRFLSSCPSSSAMLSVRFLCCARVVTPRSKGLGSVLELRGMPRVSRRQWKRSTRGATYLAPGELEGLSDMVEVQRRERDENVIVI